MSILQEFEIRFNGESRIVSSCTLVELLKEFSLEGKKVAVELNKEIIPRNCYAETEIKAGDNVEVVSFVGGG